MHPIKWYTHSAVWVLHRWGPRVTAAVSARSVYTMQPCTVSCYFIQSRIHVLLVVTCHLHFWQNEDRDLLRATPVTWGYRNKSHRRKLTGRREFTRHSCRDSNPRPFDHESGALITEFPQLPSVCILYTFSPPIRLSVNCYRSSAY